MDYYYLLLNVSILRGHEHPKINLAYNVNQATVVLIVLIFDAFASLLFIEKVFHKRLSWTATILVVNFPRLDHLFSLSWDWIEQTYKLALTGVSNYCQNISLSVRGTPLSVHFICSPRHNCNQFLNALAPLIPVFVLAIIENCMEFVGPLARVGDCPERTDQNVNCFITVTHLRPQ